MLGEDLLACSEYDIDFARAFPFGNVLHLVFQEHQLNLAIRFIQRFVRGFLGRRYARNYKRLRSIDAMKLRKEVLWKHRASRLVAQMVRKHWENQSINRKKKLAKEAHDRGELNRLVARDLLFLCFRLFNNMNTSREKIDAQEAERPDGSSLRGKPHCPVLSNLKFVSTMDSSFVVIEPSAPKHRN